MLGKIAHGALPSKSGAGRRRLPTPNCNGVRASLLLTFLFFLEYEEFYGFGGQADI